VLFWDVVQFLTDVTEQPVSPSSRIKKSKRENRVQLKLIEATFFFLTCPSHFLKIHNIPEASSVSVFRQRSN